MGTAALSGSAMTEALVVFGVVIGLVLLGTMAVLVPIEVLAITGASCIVAGFVLGLPAGAYYHYLLYRCLAARGKVPSDFIWHPTRFHAELQQHELRRIRPWFLAGALCFGMIMLGSTIILLGFLRL
jgi:hypothetical protein